MESRGCRPDRLRSLEGARLNVLFNASERNVEKIREKSATSGLKAVPCPMVCSSRFFAFRGRGPGFPCPVSRPRTRGSAWRRVCRTPQGGQAPGPCRGTCPGGIRGRAPCAFGARGCTPRSCRDGDSGPACRDNRPPAPEGVWGGKVVVGGQVSWVTPSPRRGPWGPCDFCYFTGSAAEEQSFSPPALLSSPRCLQCPIPRRPLGPIR